MLGGVFDAGRNMNAHKRNLLQIHLSTMLALAFFAAILFWINIERPADPDYFAKHVGETITVRGTGSYQKIGFSLGSLDGAVYLDLEPKENLQGRHMIVTGRLVEKFDLPVFIPDPTKEAIQGIPVPAGTDLHKASRRLVLENPQIEIIDNEIALRLVKALGSVVAWVIAGAVLEYFIRRRELKRVPVPIDPNIA